MKIAAIKTKILKDFKDGKNFFKHKNLIIVGENGSGKSSLLKHVIKKINNTTNYGKIYFIDSTNRKLVSNNEELSKNFSNYRIQNIVNERLKVENFNKKDVFSKEDGNEILTKEILDNFKIYNNLFKEILEIKLVIPKTKILTKIQDALENEEKSKILFDNTDINFLSDGLQAKIRLVMEIYFAYINNCSYVIIDEFNQNLDFKNSSTLFNKLANKYPDLRFVISTHSIHAVRDIADCDVIKINKNYNQIDENLCEIFDGNDLDNLELINKKIFESKIIKDEKSIILSDVLKKMLNGNDINSSIESLKSLENLTFKQEFIKNFILEKSDKNVY